MSRPQLTQNHAPQRMRRIVKDTMITAKGLESRYECPDCHKSIWYKLSGQRIGSFMCDGRTTGTVIPMPRVGLTPYVVHPREVITLLMELAEHTTPPLKRRALLMVRRLEAID